MPEEVVSLGRKEGQELTDVMALEKTMDLVISRAERQVDVLRKVLSIAIKRTNPTDWIDMQGKPYLGASGCEKLMPLFGISLSDTTSLKRPSHDDKGEHYVYECRGVFTWQGGSIEALGVCSSRDKFFAWDRQTKEYKALSDVDEPNIHKAAYSNMMMNGVTRLLGIRSLTWEQLKDVGIDQAKSARVEYGVAGTATPEEEDKRIKATNMLMEMFENDRDKVKEVIERLTKFLGKDGKMVNGVNSTKVLKGIRLKIFYEKVEAEYKKWKDTASAVDSALGVDDETSASA